MFEEKVVDDESQQWFWSEKNGTLYNQANPDYTLDVYEGWLYVANVKKAKTAHHGYPTTPRKWWYDDALQGLTTDVKGIKN